MLSSNVAYIYFMLASAWLIFFFAIAIFEIINNVAF